MKILQPHRFFARLQVWFRDPFLSLVVLIWMTGVVGLLAVPHEKTDINVPHWANGHLIDSLDLLPTFASAFNEQDIETNSGKPIRIKLFKANSGQIAGELRERVGHGVSVDRSKPNPTIVTPAAEHWVNEINRTAEHQVLDRSKVQAIATTYIGIVTTREMAQCLGWPQREIGFSDIAELVTDARGWERYTCARPEWGRDALVAFTYPSRSSTARSILYAMYSIAAGKAPEQLTLGDITRPDVAGPIKRLQSAIDCYVPDTLELNNKILSGSPCAHFYFLAEDNLVQMYQGKIETPGGGPAKHLERDMVMIYPKEGSIVHRHSAFVVNAPFVNSEQVEAAQHWIDFLRADNQQQTLMQAGFRPAAPLNCVNPLGSPFSQCAVTPRALIEVNRVDAEVAAAILKEWD
jgi:Ca-activated chloride channel homolog